MLLNANHHEMLRLVAFFIKPTDCIVLYGFIAISMRLYRSHYFYTDLWFPKSIVANYFSHFLTTDKSRRIGFFALIRLNKEFNLRTFHSKAHLGKLMNVSEIVHVKHSPCARIIVWQMWISLHTSTHNEASNSNPIKSGSMSKTHCSPHIHFSILLFFSLPFSLN